MKNPRTLITLFSIGAFIPLAFAQVNPSIEDEEVFELSPFVIASTAGNPYLLQQASTGTIFAMDRIDVPMDTTIVGSALIEDLALYNADDLGQAVAGVSSNESVNTLGGGGNTVYTLRGFRSVPRRNGFAPGGRLFDMTSVDRVEVIKGPNSLLYGQTDPGGIINYIPKRPMFENRNSYLATVGSYGSFRVVGDSTGPIGKGNKLAFRLPFSYSENGSDIDFYKQKRFVVAPSLLYRIGKKTEVFLEAEYLDDETNLSDLSVWWKRDANNNLVTDYNRAGFGRSFNELGPNTYSTNEQFNMTGTVTTQIGDHFHLRGMYSYNERDTEIRTMVLANNENRQVKRGANYPAFMAFPKNQVKGLKLDALYDRTFGKIDSKTLLGFEYNHNKFSNTRFNTASRLPALPNPLNGETITNDAWAWNLGNPQSNPENFNRIPSHPVWTDAEWINVRLTETIQAFDRRLTVLGGLAYGEVKRTFKSVQTEPAEDDLTHMLGATFKFTPKTAIFVNSTQSFAPVYRTGLNDEPLDSSNGQGYEVGLKFDLQETGIFATLTYFDLTNEGLPRNVPPDQSPTGEAYWVNSGEEGAAGFEVELFWEVNKQLELLFSLVSFDSKLISTANNIGTPGQDIPRVPETAGQVTLNYKFSRDGALKGLRVGLNGHYADSAAIKTNYTDPSLRSDDYFIWGGFVRYKLPTEFDTQVFLNVMNITDEEYIRPNGLYGELQRFSGGVRVAF